MMASMSLAGRYRRVVGSSFVRAVATLSTGQFIAAGIPILAAPVLGRLYLPADYGVLGVYMAIANVLAVISTFQLQQAIIAERFDRRAVALIQLCIWVSVPVALVAALVGGLLVWWMSDHPAYNDARLWVLMLPVSVMAAAAVQAIAVLANRRRKYGAVARIQVYVATMTVLVSIGLGLLGWGVDGLFAGYFGGQAVALVMQLWLYRNMVGKVPRLGSGTAVALIRRHRAFPTYSLPSELLLTVNLQMPVFALTSLGATSLLGSFVRARQLISMPLTLLGGSITQVFQQRAAEQYRETGSCRRLYEQTFLALIGIGLLPTALLVIFAPELFRIFLGPNWGEAGEITRILAPMLLLRLGCSPLTRVFSFTGHQKLAFRLSVASGIACAVGVIGPVIMGWSAIYSVVGFSVTYSFVYLAYLVIGWRLTTR